MEPLNPRLLRLFNAWCDDQEGSAEFAQAVQSREVSVEMLGQLIQARWQAGLAAGEGSAYFTEAESGRLLERIREQIKEARQAPVRRLTWKQVAVAASIALVLGSSAYFAFFQKDRPVDPIVHTKEADVEAPASNRAMITLADGRQVLVDSLTSITQNQVALTKTADGQLVYSGSATATVYNTLTNPRGSKVIDMTLADGSRVWLNAGSSVSYPVAFTDHERRISITGEAYFEVAPSALGGPQGGGGALRSFIVEKGDMQVQVLGTHFNVNAHDDEPAIKVTLLEGSVRVNKGSDGKLLKPGQQAQVTDNIAVMSGIDTEQVMAWKNGVFRFRNTNITEIMREVARWYDVDIRYQGRFDDLNFGGTVSRQANISELLKRLETTKAVRFTVEGRAVTVMPY